MSTVDFFKNESSEKNESPYPQNPFKSFDIIKNDPDLRKEFLSTTFEQHIAVNTIANIINNSENKNRKSNDKSFLDALITAKPWHQLSDLENSLEY